MKIMIMYLKKIRKSDVELKHVKFALALFIRNKKEKVIVN